MSRRIIPERIEITCDVCGKVCDNSNRRMQGRIVINRHGLDYQGCAVGQGGSDCDCCDDCIIKLEKAIELAVANIRGI